MKKALLVLFATGWFLCGFAQEIKFETIEHDFGLVNYNDPAVFDFVFTNTGTEPLIVQKPKSSCGCLIPSWPKDPIMPGKKDKVSVTYDTKKVGNMNRSVTVTSNAKGSPLIVLKVKGLVLTEDGKIKPSQKNGLWGIEDEKGNVIVPFEYDKIIANFKNGLAKVKKDDKYYFIDKNKMMYEIRGDAEGPNGVFNARYNDGCYEVRKDGKDGFINSVTHEIIIPVDYEDVGFFSYENGATVKKNGRWGVVDKFNHVIIPFEYQELHEFEGRYAIAKKNNQWGVIDETNQVIIPFEYEAIKYYTKNESFRAQKNGKRGVIDTTNSVIEQFK